MLLVHALGEMADNGAPQHPSTIHQRPLYSSGTVYHKWTFNVSATVNVIGTGRPHRKLTVVPQSSVVNHVDECIIEFIFCLSDSAYRGHIKPHLCENIKWISNHNTHMFFLRIGRGHYQCLWYNKKKSNNSVPYNHEKSCTYCTYEGIMVSPLQLLAAFF